MHTFGSTGIVTGYIKQLLSSFNLPTIHIYTKELEDYLSLNRVESPKVIESVQQYSDSTAHSTQAKVESFFPYIKDGILQTYSGGYYHKDNKFVAPTWHQTKLVQTEDEEASIKTYERGSFIPNFTKRLQLKNNVYDSYTHEYLGDYLRFIRDYDEIDLMPLYNCFSNKVFSGKIAHKNNTIVFDSRDDSYRIFAVPVRLFKSYTIAIDSAYPIELCCSFLSQESYLDDTLADPEGLYKLLSLTHLRIVNTRFNKPFLYSALNNLVPPIPEYPLNGKALEEHRNARDLLAAVASREKDLHLLIKISKQVDSSITILEGNYCDWNDFVCNPAESFTRGFKVNHTEVSHELVMSGTEVPLKTSLQLLRFNTKKQMPFADRLLEYLLDNCVTGGDEEVRENVLMAQFLAKLYYSGSSKGIGAKAMRYTSLNGVWEPALKKLFYQYMYNQNNNSTINHDVLGYVDKDVERQFTATEYRSGGQVRKRTMINFDAWEDIKE